HHVRDQPHGSATRRRQRHLHSDGHGRFRWRRVRWRVRRRRRLQRKLFRRRWGVGRRRRLGGLVMILEPGAAGPVAAAFDTAQLKTRAPLVCVLAGASPSLDAEFLLGACILALATPLPLLLFTDLSAHRIYVAQLLIAILAAVLASLPPVRRWLIPKRVARSAGHRAALAQFVLRGVDPSRGRALVSVSVPQPYLRITP